MADLVRYERINHIISIISIRLLVERNISINAVHRFTPMNTTLTAAKVVPTENDVLCGRGNGVNLHAGNQKFRAMIKALKPEYVAASKPDKSSFPYLVVAEIQNASPPGRFMKYCPKTDQWHELPMKQAITKTRQALREGAPDIVESQKGDSRKSAVYVVDEIKKIVVSLVPFWPLCSITKAMLRTLVSSLQLISFIFQRDAGRTHVPVPSNREIPCPKATDPTSSKKRSAPSPTHVYQNHAPTREMVCHFDKDTSLSYHGSYERPRLSNADKYSALVQIAAHTSSLRPSAGLRNNFKQDTAKEMKPSLMNVTSALSASRRDDSATAMQQLPSQYVAAAALLDLSHCTYSYTGGKNI